MLFILIPLSICFLIKMIVSFVGTIDEDESALPITGNGKTSSMCGFGMLDEKANREIWSNFKTDFSTQIIGFQEMVDKVMIDAEKDISNPNLILMVTEMRKLLDAVGSTTDQMLYIDNFVEQIRKIGATLYYDTQRFYSIHKRLRIHTNVIFIPYKTHFDEKPCYLPSCMKPHKIYVFSYKPYKEKPVKCFDAAIIAKHYDSLEFCKDALRLPKKIAGVY